MRDHAFDDLRTDLMYTCLGVEGGCGIFTKLIGAAQTLAERGEVPDLLLKATWRRDGAFTAELCERAVDVQINRLRRKIEHDPANPVYLQTVRGKGYILYPE